MKQRDDRSVASSLLELSRALIGSGELAAARRHLSRALAIRRRAYGAEHLRLADLLGARGEANFLAGNDRAARADWQRALAIRRAKSRTHAAVERLDCFMGLTARVGEERMATLQRCSR